MTEVTESRKKRSYLVPLLLATNLVVSSCALYVELTTTTENKSVPRVEVKDAQLYREFSMEVKPLPKPIQPKVVQPKPKPVQPKPQPKPKLAPPVVVKKQEASTNDKKIMMTVTGYTAGYESTQKKKGEPGYGITASGATVQQGVTVAAGKGIPFGTKVYIPYFKGKTGFGDGVFTVQDRGGAIGSHNIDVYFNSLIEARQFGRQHLEVYILEEK